MLNEKWCRPLTITGFLSFTALMCLVCLQDHGWVDSRTAPAIAMSAFILIILTVFSLSASIATLWSSSSEGAGIVIFMAAGVTLILFLSVVFRTETSVQILLAFLSMRQALIVLHTSREMPQQQSTPPSARLIR